MRSSQSVLLIVYLENHPKEAGDGRFYRQTINLEYVTAWRKKEEEDELA